MIGVFDDSGLQPGQTNTSRCSANICHVLLQSQCLRSPRAIFEQEDWESRIESVQSQETEMGKGLDSSSIKEAVTFSQSTASEYQDLITLDRYSGNQGLPIRKYLKPYRAHYADSQSSKL